MALRTIAASGKVYNNGKANVAATFRVRLMIEITDEHDVLIQGPMVIATSDDVLVAAGARSGTISLTASRDIAPGTGVTAWCRLDRVSPSPTNDISRSAGAYRFEEITPVYGGTLEGFTPTIAAPVGRLVGALVEAGTR